MLASPKELRKHIQLILKDDIVAWGQATARRRQPRSRSAARAGRDLADMPIRALDDRRVIHAAQKEKRGSKVDLPVKACQE